MPAVAMKKEKKGDITVVKGMKNYADEPVFKKKVEKATAFLRRNGLPDTFMKKKK